MPAVKLLHGNPTMVDHIAATNLVAGDVVVDFDTPKIAHKDIASGQLGALAAEGGVYTATADGAIGVDKKVYWDSVTKKITATAGTFKVFGVTVSNSTGVDQPVNVRHDPSA